MAILQECIDVINVQDLFLVLKEDGTVPRAFMTFAHSVAFLKLHHLLLILNLTHNLTHNLIHSHM